MPASRKKLDFRGVKDKSPFRVKHLPEGEYRAKILEVDDHESDENVGWVWTIGVTRGPGKGAKYPYYTMHKKSNLWKVRNLLQAAGMKVPKKLMGVDPNKAVGKELGIVLEDDEYEGKMRSAIADLLTLSELGATDDEEYDEDDDEEIEEEDEEVEEEDDEDEDEEDEEEEEPAPRKKKSKAKAKKKKKAKPARDEDEDDEEEEVDEDELEELEVDEL